ncbi:MAG: hypothetical protein V1800_06310 [Candidatus Latescibacterota bacterium]
MEHFEDKKVDQKVAAEMPRKVYEKPGIIHSSSIETMAGSCIQTVACTPNYY